MVIEMKALIRNEGETVTQDMDLTFINWDTGAPLTNPGWYGGPYQLVDNYVEVTDGAIYDVAVYPEPEDPVTEDNVQDTIVIDGKRYNKEELRSLLQ